MRQLRSAVAPVPPLNEQRRIVAKIEDLTARSQAAKQALDAIPPLLERFRQSVLAAAFRGDLTKQWRQQNPEVEPATELLKRIRQERRHRWEQDYLAQQKAKGKTPKDDKWKEKYQEPEPVNTTGLPELPEGWCWANVGEIGKVQGGIQKQPSRKPVQNAYPFLRVANVQENRLDLQEIHQIELQEGELEKLRLERDDLLIVEGNGSPSGIGRMAVWDGSIPNCVHQNHLIRVRTSSSVNPDYVCAFWQSPLGKRKVFEQAQTTTGLYTLSVLKISLLPVPVAPYEEQIQIKQGAQQILRSLARYRSIQDECQDELQRLSQSILAKAFRGELVPQDPSDEPASELLSKLKEQKGSEATPRRPRPADRRATMGKIDADTVRKAVLKLNSDRFSFDDLRQVLSGDYNQLKDALFEVLGEESPVVQQEFDQATHSMQFRRIRR